MQLDQSLIRSGLCHSDKLVRDIVGFWFNDRTPALAPRTSEIIRAYDEFGLTSVSDLRPHVCDEALLDWILDQATRDFGLPTIDNFEAYHVWHMLVKADLALVSQRLADIRRAVDAWHARHDSPQTQLKVVALLEARLEAARQGPAECFRQILPLCATIDSLHVEDQHELREAKLRELDALVEIAAESDCSQQVLQHLAHADHDGSGYGLVAMMQLATRMNLQAAAPLAIELMDTDWSTLHEAIAGFFVANTNPELQALISQRFDDLPWDQQLYLGEVFAADYSPTAAAYLRQHLQVAIDRDEYDKIVTLAQLLAFQFCIEDIERLDDVYQFGYTDPELVQVAETLYVLDELGSLKHFRASHWKRAQAIVLELEEAAKRHQISRPQRPGRNSPCPCGSGKKYKKCCWQTSPTS